MTIALQQVSAQCKAVRKVDVTVLNDPARSIRLSPPAMAAITVTYNSVDVLDDFLASIAVQRGIEWRLIIVDNASTDGTLERLSTIDDPRITVVPNASNIGFAAGTNIGIKLALKEGVDRFLLINNDTVFEADLFTNLCAKLDSSGHDAVSPVILFDSDEERIWYAGGGFDWRRGIKIQHDNYFEPKAAAPREDTPTDFCPACCMMIRRSVFDGIGLLDEDYFVYWEDADFFWRMQREGMTTIVTPEIEFRHKASALTGGPMSPFRLRFHYRNRILFVRKQFGLPTLLYSTGMTLAGIVGRWLMRGDKERDTGLRLRAVLEGLRVPLSPAQAASPATSFFAE